MRILFIGGTRFVGRHMVEEALRRGHDVTLFHRGKTSLGLFPNVDERIGDRDGGLEILGGDCWDACIDTCGYIPRIVRATAAFLAGSVVHYTFISSVSVYQDFTDPDPDEKDGALATLADPSTEEVNGDTYGGLKVLCERACEAEMPGSVLVIRPGLIVGPHDPTDRFTYWPMRIARGGTVAAPGRPEARIQWIDARDLAHWTLERVEAGTTGVYNTTGPEDALTMGRFLDACLQVTASGAALRWIPDPVLEQLHIEAFSEMPLWIPGADMNTSCDRARALGLKFRPIADTIRDTIHWAAGRPEPHVWRAGLTEEREAALLAHL